MNERMEQEMEQTIRTLKASLPQARRRAPAMVLLRIAAEELSAPLLLGLLAGVILLGVSCGRLLDAPLLAVFCTAPMPMLLLFHRYVCTDGRMRELEQTLSFSLTEMLLARSAMIGCYMLAALLLLSAALPAYSQALFLSLGVPQPLAPTLANLVNIAVQVILSYPAMKFWIMPSGKGKAGT